MHFVQSLLLIATVALLGACAPTQMGASANAPFMVENALQVTNLKPGGTWYLARDYNPTALGLTTERINSVLPSVSNYSTGNVYRQSIGGYSLGTVEAPRGWKVNLAAVNIKRTIMDVSGGFVYFRDAAEITMGVEVPMGATAGGLVSAQVRTPEGNSVPVIFLVGVEGARSAMAP